MLNYFRDKNEGTCLRSGEGRKEPASSVTPGEVGVRLGREKEKQKSEKTEDGTSKKKKGDYTPGVRAIDGSEQEEGV